MIQFSKPGDNIDSDTFGRKAYWINWLYENGYRTPETVFVSRLEDKSDLDNIEEVFIEEIEKNFKFTEAENKYGLAVRSSSLLEDGFYESRAGEFDTFLGYMSPEEAFINYRRVLKSGEKYGDSSMGSVIQELIDSEVSGVIFSSNPLNGSKKEMVMSISEGTGERLVSGKAKGENFILKLSEDSDLCCFEKDTYDEMRQSELCGIYSDTVLELARKAKDIERKLNFPVDIEWTSDGDGKLYILQVRPVSSIFIEKPNLRRVKAEEIKSLSSYLTDSDKIKLRLLSEEKGVRISDAYIAAVNCRGPETEIPSLDEIERSPECRGYSAVLIYPKRIDGRILRSFIGYKDRFQESAKPEYRIKKVPEFESLEECLRVFIEKADKENWNAVVIIQEIYDPKYTGIMNNNEDMYILEFAEGHFASKGIIPMSRYIVKDGKIEDSNEIVQKKRIRIIEGYTFEEEICRKVSVEEENVLKTVDTLEPISKPGIVTEFGITDEPYLIDVFKENADFEIDSIRDGVISRGKLEGRLVKLRSDTSKSLDTHYYDKFESECEKDEKIVFYSELPDISFVEIVNRFKRENIGFIFKEGSILCHLSILLRENCIPSIIGYDIDSLEEGKYFKMEI